MAMIQTLRRSLLVLLGGSLFWLGAEQALAQGKTQEKAAPLLTGSRVTADRLEDALAVPPKDAPPDAQMRGFRPASPGQKPKRWGPGKANLLITFVTAKAELTDSSRAQLDVLAKAMQRDALAGVSFRIEGHADARGDAEANRVLSLARAEAVAAYLSDKHGVLKERLKPEGKGATEPMNKARVDAPENRRVTVVSMRV
jgi:OmpA-OmpF porin, OOP family